MVKHALRARIYRNVEKGRVTTRKILVLKSCSIVDFYPEYYIPEIENGLFVYHMLILLSKSTVQVKFMAYFLVDTISTTANIHGIM